MTISVADAVRSAQLEVVVRGDGLDRPVGEVRVLDGAVSAETAEGPGVLAVVPWAAPRRGSPLPPLGPLLSRALAVTPVAVLVVPRGRAVRPPSDALELARSAGVPLLWTGTDQSEVLDRLRRAVLAAPQPEPGLPAGVAAVFDGDLDLVSVAERVAEVLGATVTVTDAAGRILVDLLRHLPGPDGSSGDGPGDEDGGADEVRESDGAVMPLLHAGRQLGSWRVGRPTALGPAERLLVEVVTPVLVLALRVHTTEQRAAAPVQELLAVVLGEDLAARESAVRRSRRLAAFPARPAVFLVLVSFGTDVASAGLSRLARAVEPAIRAVDARATVLVHEGSVVALVAAEVDLDRLQRAMYRRVRVPLSVGASRAVDDVRSFPGAHRQAQRAAAIGRALGTANRVNRFDDLGVTRLLYQLPEHERKAFTRDVLGELADDGPAAVEARRVLRSYRATNGNATESARQLFLHHNTFRQRLAKLQERLGDFVTDPERRMAVFVALDLHRLDNDREA